MLVNLYCCCEDNTPLQSSRHSAIEEFEDLLEARQQEVAVFQPSPRPTAVDRSGNMRSVQRQLDKVLYLLVKKDRSSHCWQMPQGGLLGEGESLLQVTLTCAVPPTLCTSHIQVDCVIYFRGLGESYRRSVGRT